MKSLFRDANAGDAADEFKHTFSYDEFVDCVRKIVKEVTIACDGGALPKKVAMLRDMLAAPNDTTSGTTTAATTDTQVALNTSAEMQAKLIATYDNDNATDGVRVPVNQLWASVREVESHLQTEEQLRTALDRLAGERVWKLLATLICILLCVFYFPLRSPYDTLIVFLVCSPS